MPYTVETLALIVRPFEESLYSELATRIQLEDEGGGLFVEVTQPGFGDGSIRIEPDEWPAIKSAIDSLVNRVQWHTPDEPPADEWLCSDYKHSGDPEPAGDSVPDPNF